MIFTLPAAEVNIGFLDDAIVVNEPINFTVSVVLFQNNLDPGTEISLSLVGMDGVAAGTALQYSVLNGLCIGNFGGGGGLQNALLVLFMFPAQKLVSAPTVARTHMYQKSLHTVCMKLHVHTYMYVLV